LGSPFGTIFDTSSFGPEPLERLASLMDTGPVHKAACALQSRAVPTPTEARGQAISAKSHKTVAKLFIVAMLGMHAFFLWSVRGRIARADPDFTVFYTAGKMLREGKGSQLYTPRIQQQVQNEFATNSDIRVGPLPYIHPPFEAILFIPLTLLPYREAFGVWSLINLSLLFAVCWLLRSTLTSLRGFKTWQLVLICLAFFPVLAEFHQGQDAVLLLLLVTLAFRDLGRDALFAAGCWIGLGIFKYHLILPLALILGAWKGRRLISGFVIVSSAATLVSLGLVGWREALEYPSYAWHVVSEPALGGIPFRRLPNLLGLIAGWPFSEHAGWFIQVAVAASCIGLLIAVTLLLRPAPDCKSWNLSVACAVIVAVLVGYSTNTYDLCLLIVPLALVADHWFQQSDRNWAAMTRLVVPAFPLCLSPLWFFLWMRWERINLMAIFLLWWLFAIRSEVVRVESKKEPIAQPAIT
jgi:hypothetical protein